MIGNSLILNRFLARGKSVADPHTSPAATPVPTVAANEPASKEADIAGTTDIVEIPASPIVAVLGAKGGVGATTVAVDLATVFAQQQISTTILDANFQQPDIAHLLGNEPPHSILAMVSRLPNIDRQLYDACATAVNDSSLSFLSAPLDGQAGIKTDLTQMADCLRLIRPYNEFWIVDLPRHLDKHLVNLTDLCDKIVLVFEATVSGVAATQRWLGIFRELGYEQDKIICVLNRSGSKYRAVEQQLGDCFNEQPILSLPNASPIAWECSIRGVPISMAHPTHAYTKAIQKLADRIKRSVCAR